MLRNLSKLTDYYGVSKKFTSLFVGQWTEHVGKDKFMIIKIKRFLIRL